MGKARKADIATKTGAAEVPTVPIEVVSSAKKTTKSSPTPASKTAEKAPSKSNKT